MSTLFEADVERLTQWMEQIATQVEQISLWAKGMSRRLDDLEGEVAAVSEMLHTIHARGVRGPSKRGQPEGGRRDRDQEINEYIRQQKAEAATPEEARAAIQGYRNMVGKKGGGDEPQLHDSANPRP